MRILLDECVPAKLAGFLPCHHVGTVQGMQWSSMRNGALWARAAAEFDAFITVDRSMPHQQKPPPSLALITLNVPSNSVEAVAALAPQILAALADLNRGGNTRI